VDERLRFVARLLDGEVTEVCRELLARRHTPPGKPQLDLPPRRVGSSVATISIS
jgi:hypothetical protein